MRQASETLSEPEFRHKNFVYGQLPRLLADVGLQGVGEAELADARRHDVGHHLRSRHRCDHSLGRVAEAKHAVAAAIVDQRPLEGDDPGPARGQCHVRIDRVVGVEVDEFGLHARDLLGFVQRQQFG